MPWSPGSRPPARFGHGMPFGAIAVKASGPRSLPPARTIFGAELREAELERALLSRVPFGTSHQEPLMRSPLTEPAEDVRVVPAGVLAEAVDLVAELAQVERAAVVAAVDPRQRRSMRSSGDRRAAERRGRACPRASRARASAARWTMRIVRDIGDLLRSGCVSRTTRERGFLTAALSSRWRSSASCCASFDSATDRPRSAIAVSVPRRQIDQVRVDDWPGGEAGEREGADQRHADDEGAGGRGAGVRDGEARLGERGDDQVGKGRQRRRRDRPGCVAGAPVFPARVGRADGERVRPGGEPAVRLAGSCRPRTRRRRASRRTSSRARRR